MIRRRLVAFAAAWFAVCGLSAGVFDEVRERKAVRIAGTFDYRPFSYIDEGNRSGIDVDLGNALARALGVRVIWVETSWPQLLTDLELDRFDIGMSGISITEARTAVAHFSRPYFNTGKVALARCDRNRRFRSVADIDKPDLTVIFNPGGTNESFVRREIHRARLHASRDNIGIFAALASGEADLMITDAVEAAAESARNPSLCYDAAAPFLEAIDKAWLLPRDDAWRAWLDAWLAHIVADGTLASVIENHVSPAREPERAPPAQ